MADIIIGPSARLTHDQYSLLESTFTGMGAWQLEIENGWNYDVFQLEHKRVYDDVCEFWDAHSQVLTLQPEHYVISRSMYICLPEWTIRLYGPDAEPPPRVGSVSPITEMCW